MLTLTVGRLPFVLGVLPLALIIFDRSSSLGLRERPDVGPKGTDN